MFGSHNLSTTWPDMSYVEFRERYHETMASVNRDTILGLLQKHTVQGTDKLAKTGNILCPVCDGGRSREKSFEIWVTPNLIMYKCRRGTCGVGGRHSTLDADYEVKTSDVVRNLFTGGFLPLGQNDKAVKYVTNKYHWDGIDCDGVNIALASPCGRLAVSLRDYYGIRWGLELRAWLPVHSDMPKASRKYMSINSTQNSLAWARVEENRQPGRDLFVTEDVISAYRIRHDCNQDAVALLGTNLRQADAEEILRHGYQRLRLVLDPDEAGAAGARKLMKAHDFMFDISAHSLPKDPKNLQPWELEEWIAHIVYTTRKLDE